TFWPSTQFLPMRAPAATWQKCQILVPAPIFAPSSTMADSWANQSRPGMAHQHTSIGHFEHPFQRGAGERVLLLDGNRGRDRRFADVVELGRDLLEKTAGRARTRGRALRAGARVSQIEQLAGAGDADVHEPALLAEIDGGVEHVGAVGVERAAVRDQLLL